LSLLLETALKPLRRPFGGGNHRINRIALHLRRGGKRSLDRARYVHVADFPRDELRHGPFVRRRENRRRAATRLAGLLDKAQAGETDRIRCAERQASKRRKVKRLALKSVLSAKAAQGNVLIVDSLGMDEIKTKTFQAFLNAVDSKKAVVVTACPNVVKSARNIPGVVTTPANLINVYDIVNANQLIIDKAALATIEEVFA